MQEKLMDTIRSMLWEEWDPIGVNQFAEARDEYDNYVSPVWNAITNGASEEELFRLLWSIETVHMGLDGDEPSTRRFAKLLCEISSKS